MEHYGYAVGVLGMRHADFARLTPGQWVAIIKARMREDDRSERQAWERMRLLATIVVQPHCRKKLKATELLPLPWDKSEEREERKVLSRAEARARYERLKARMSAKRKEPSE